MAKLTAKKLTRHFWNEESGLTSIFIVLCISNFLVVPFFNQRLTILILVRITWFILLVAGITSMARNRAQMRKLSIIPILLVIVSTLQIILDNKILAYIDFVVELSVFALMIGMVIIKVFEGGSVTIHRVVGSIVAYMLIGNAWAIMFQFLYIQIPGSMQIPAVYTESGVPNSVFLYFSFTTLTTTGYGEILPVHAAARTLVIIEQLIGVLYPVVLIGRLVSLVAGNPGTSEENKQ
jgi:hypothetical protein